MESSNDQPSPAGTMKAFTHTASGLPPAILHLSHNLPIPILAAPTDVLVKVSHASLNPGGSIITRLVPMAFRTKPSIPDMDFSGTVTKTSKSVPVSRELVPGTAVFGTVPVSQHVMGGKGALAEYVAVPAENLVLKPSNVSFEEAAGLPITGVTATSCMDLAKVKKGERVLVYGASGGIGSLVVQMAKGAVGDEGVVVGVCSGRNLEMVKGLGADEVGLISLFDLDDFC
jgi:NADPH:quinone reductase-like Zn-dependent oxidoreductase